MIITQIDVEGKLLILILVYDNTMRLDANSLILVTVFKVRRNGIGYVTNRNLLFWIKDVYLKVDIFGAKQLSKLETRTQTWNPVFR
jgi:hypothetical protein